MTASIVPEIVDYARLQDLNYDLSSSLEQAFGEHGLGIIAISDVPEYVDLRRKLLPLASKLAALAEGNADFKRKYEDPESSYSFGWSCGQEILQDGMADKSKGSFYANPLIDEPTVDEDLLHKYPQYTRPNIWPRDELPDLEVAFKRLGKLIFDVGRMLLGHCEKFLSLHDVPAGQLEQCLLNSFATKGRLLCYLPHSTDSGKSRDDNKRCKMEMQRNWCGWHKDHSALTGLTAAMYTVSPDVGQEESCLDPMVGLRIMDRCGNIKPVHIPTDCIAFQVGEVLEIVSGGVFQATPHCVTQPEETALYRNTFAVFMQPHWDHILRPLTQNKDFKLLSPNETFGEFSRKRFDKYYAFENGASRS